MLTGAQVIVVATPVFLLSIAAEYAIGRWRGRDTYRWADAMASVGLGIVSQLVSAGTKLFGFGVYALVFQHLALWRLPADAWWVWLAALLGYDLCYYAYHRFGHRVALGWAAHAVHHQSEYYNLSTALRQTSTGFLTTWVFYLPLAVLGVPPRCGRCPQTASHSTAAGGSCAGSGRGRPGSVVRPARYPQANCHLSHWRCRSSGGLGKQFGQIAHPASHGL